MDARGSKPVISGLRSLSLFRHGVRGVYDLHKKRLKAGLGLLRALLELLYIILFVLFLEICDSPFG